MTVSALSASFEYLMAAEEDERRRRKTGATDAAFDMPDDVFQQHFHMIKPTVCFLCEELAEELGSVRTLSVEQQVLCALRFFATGSFSTVENDGTFGVAQAAVSECVLRVAKAIVHVGTRDKWVEFPRTPQDKAVVKDVFRMHGGIPGVIGCVDSTLVAIKEPECDDEAWFMAYDVGYYALNVMLICNAEARILAIDPSRPGSDPDSHVWIANWLRRRFLDGLIIKPGEFLLGDSSYPLEPWLLTPIPGHPPAHTAEGRYNAAHAGMWNVVRYCIKLLKSRFHCLQRCHALQYEPEPAADIVAACAALHNLSLDDEDESLYIDESSNSTIDDDDRGDPYSQGVPRRWSPRSFYYRGLAVRDGVVGLFGTTRQQHQSYLRRVRKRLRQQHHRQQHQQ